MITLECFIDLFKKTIGQSRKGEREIQRDRGIPLLPFSISIGIFILLVLATLTLAQEPSLESRVFEIARELRCPVCTSESVGDSSSSVAIEMRNIIQDQLEQGKSKTEILAFFQERYGDWIMLEPPKRGIHLLVWVLPVIASLIGLGLLFTMLKRWTKKSRAPIEVSSEDLGRVREEMKWQDS